MHLTETEATRLPTPPQMNNHGNYIISLGNFCRWLGEQAEALGVEIYPGFAAAEVLYHEDGSVGRGHWRYGRGPRWRTHRCVSAGHGAVGQADHFAEGCRGSLTKTLFERFDLRAECDVQTYGIGIKELWEVKPEHHQPGSITHHRLADGQQDLWRLFPVSPGKTTRWWSAL